MDYENKSEVEFDKVGMAMLRREAGGSKSTHDRRFIANYGCLPRTCAELWRLILTSGHSAFMVEVDNMETKKPKKRYSFQFPPYKPKHLLWALYLCKCYPTENQGIGMVATDEKTFRKWTWIFIEATASMKNEVVSNVVFDLI